jgi:hypothetical protein
MPERRWDTGCWDSDEWFQDLSRDQRYLFWYLSTNPHCNQAGLYHITLTTISNEAKFTKEELVELLPSLEPKVKWYPVENLIWVKNFIKRQSSSPKFYQAVAKALTTIKSNGPIQELLRYNMERYRVSIPYSYPTDRVSIPSDSYSDSYSLGKGESKGGEGFIVFPAADLKPDSAAEEVWTKALSELRGKVTKANFRTWFTKTQAISYMGDTFILGAPNAQTAEYIRDNQHSLIESAIINFTHPGVKVVFAVIEEKPP